MHPSARDTARQAGIVNCVCVVVHQQLLDGGWVHGRTTNPFLTPLLNDKIELESG